MKHKLLFLFISIFFFNSIKAQDFQWVRQIGNQQSDEAQAVEVDNDGNSYSLGVAQSYTYDLDPTPNGTQIINNNSTPFSPYADIYLIKLNNNGDFVWGKTFGDLKSGQSAYEIKIGPDGNIYLLLQTADFVSNQINSYFTIIKISPNGNELSKIKIKNPGSFFINSFDIDNQNNLLVGGWFVNSKTININNTDVKFESQNSIASYIFKLDNSGNFIWKKIFDYPEPSNVKIHTKPDGNIITVLNTSDHGYPMCSIFNINTSNANILWEKKLSQQGIETFHLDRKGNIILAGTNGVYQGPIDVDPSSNVVNTSSQKFLLWLDSDGNFLDLKEYFVAQFSADFRMWQIESDAQNNIYLVGDFAGKVDADPSANDFFLENPYGSIQYGSGYVIKFDSNRNFDKAYMLISNYRSLVKDIKVKNKSIYLLGDFNGECDFDPGVGSQIFDSLHNGGVLTSDGFIVKLSPCDSSKPDGEESQFFCTSQNATIGDLAPNFSGIKWYDNATNGNILSSTSALQNGKTYFASQSTNICETERLAVTVTITNTPLAPLELNSRAFCKNENATLNDIQIDGQNLKWYSSYMAASIIPITTLLENNTTYYVSQTKGCESDRTPILVKIKDTNLPIAKAEQPFCINQNATIADINIQGTGIIWYDAAIAGNALAETTFLENKTYYAAQTLNSCESKRLAVAIKIQDIQNPIAKSPQTFCIQKNAKISDIDIKGENIKWFESLSATTTLSESTLLQNEVTYYASQTVNNCESDRVPVTIKVLGATTGDCINFVDELPYPKFFTPNNDTYNDYWTIDFAYLAPNTGIKIFDRYGKLIKELVNSGVWDGNYLGQELPASDYWFTVTRLDGTEYRGHFSLKR
ncbi:T9SS type B sorting domain-containing protein [Flavobacterium sp. JAS]|uniref:T9SS type B sorting domain-containing protein n=1 Tax=Flavobacterium sp. JAS TaxID=2897329 RepID=UPI001E38947E|nr:T9SS type B sorting domain-containing protein [Flavobacterium sp. JAS]MCD0471299.1 T9SS type B sorting domain-containing protein [Flavobacterium sp. JAS]